MALRDESCQFTTSTLAMTPTSWGRLGEVWGTGAESSMALPGRLLDVKA